MQRQAPIDAILAFSNPDIITKKTSKVAEVRQLKDRLIECHDLLRSLLREIDLSFNVDVNLSLACVDDSVVKRNFFKVNCPSNRMAAVVGDKLLSLRIAQASFVAGNSAERFQTDSSRVSANDHLAAKFDQYLSPACCLLLVEDEPSTRQKATLLEAVVGCLYMYGHEDLAFELVRKIIAQEDQT